MGSSCADDKPDQAGCADRGDDLRGSDRLRSGPPVADRSSAGEVVMAILQQILVLLPAMAVCLLPIVLVIAIEAMRE